MASLNQCNFVGNLGRDPETKYTPDGDAVTNFSIACSESWKDKNSGEKKENTEWVRCVAWRQLGEICGQYLKKGSQVFVSGKLTTRKWKDKEGVERYTTEIVVDKMVMLGGRQEGERTERAAEPKPERKAAAAAGGFDDMNDDIPFITLSDWADPIWKKLNRRRAK